MIRRTVRWAVPETGHRLQGKAARIARLLRSRDPFRVDQGVALARALGDGRIFRDLLQGTRFIVDEDGIGTIEPGPKLQRAAPDRPYAVRAVLGLLAVMPGHAAADWRQAISALAVDAATYRRREAGVPTPFSLAGLERLERLDLLIVARPHGIDVGGKNLALTTLRILGGEIDSLAPFRHLEGLRNLSMDDFGEGYRTEPTTLRSFEGARTLPALTSLSLSARLPADLGPLRGHPGLRVLELSQRATGAAPPRSLAAIGDMPELQRLHLGLRLDLARLDLGTLPSLRSLSLFGQVEDLGDLSRFPALSTLRLFRPPATFVGATGAPGLRLLEIDELDHPPRRTAWLGDVKRLAVRRLDTPALAWLRDARKLEILELASLATPDVASLPTLPSLEDLVLEGCPPLHDLSFLERQPRLRRVWLGEDVEWLEDSIVPASIRPTLRLEPAPDFFRGSPWP
ncbi:MAG: hypothetical protein AAGH15_02825 [Myxococcota bacterium]